MLAVEVGALIESADIFYDVFIRPLHGTLDFIKSYQSVNVKFIEHPKGRFTRSNFGPIIISNFFVYDEKCWRSHKPIFPSNYFVKYSRETRQFLF